MSRRTLSLLVGALCAVVLCSDHFVCGHGSGDAYPDHACTHGTVTRPHAPPGAQPQTHLADVEPRQASAATRKDSKSSAAGKVEEGEEENGLWSPIRIAAFTADIELAGRYCSYPGEVVSSLVCGADDVLTAEKKQMLLEHALPGAIAMHQQRLLVQPAASILADPSGVTGGYFCSMFPTPAPMDPVRLNDTDFVLFVSAAPEPPRTGASSAECLADPTTGRPVTAVLNVSPRHLVDADRATRIVAHEILHTLGFQSSRFLAAGHLEYVVGVRGKPKKVPVNTGPKTVAAARRHFGCENSTHVEMEDAGTTKLPASHWKKRNLKDELMSEGPNGAMRYTALSIAAMEDLGFYRGNYSNAEEMAWGGGVGCGFLDGPCVRDGTPLFPREFCATAPAESPDLLFCTADRAGTGRCGVKTFPDPLFVWEQYFSQPNVGGDEAAMDYCPYVRGSDDGSCATGVPVAMPGSVLSPSARCLSAEGAGVTYGGHTVTALCADIRCDDATARTYSVRFRGIAEFVPCPAGHTIAPGGSSTNGNGSNYTVGAVVCPDFDSVCSGNDSNSFGNARTEAAFDAGRDVEDSSNSDSASSAVAGRRLAAGVAVLLAAGLVHG